MAGNLKKVCSVFPVFAVLGTFSNLAAAADVQWSDSVQTLAENSSQNGGALSVPANDSNYTDINVETGIQNNGINISKSADNPLDTAVVGQGGAIYNQGTIGTITADFSGNFVKAVSNVAGSISANGGAIAGFSGGKISEITGDFNKNTVSAILADGVKSDYENTNALATAAGGAIYLDGVSGSENSTTTEIGTINGDFVLNSAVADAVANGGAIYINSGNEANVAIGMINGHFKGNNVVATTDQEGLPASTGGAVSVNVSGDKTATINSTGNFVSNSVSTNATDALGGAIYNEGTVTIDGHFANNFVVSESGNANGGAVYNTGTFNLADNKTFFGNRAGYAGGAIYNEGQITALNGTIFQNNISQIGGAINNDDGTENSGKRGNIGSIADASFSGNISSAGGAIRNQGDIGSIQNTNFNKNMSSDGGAIWNGTSGIISEISDSFFTNNTSVTGEQKQGGAITNYNQIEKIADTVFSGNRAAENGGAIFNAESASISFYGNNTFSNNFAKSGANDIHNLGTITFVDGVTSLNGGISGDTGVLNLNEGATLDIGTAVIEQETLNINGNINASLINSSSYGKLHGNLVAGENSSLTLSIGTVGNYSMFDNNIGNMKLVYNENLYTVTATDSGVIVKTISVEDIAKANNISYLAAGTLSGLANSNSFLMGIASLNAQEAIENGNLNYVEAEAAKLEYDAKPLTQSIAASMQNQIMSAVSDRMVGGLKLGAEKSKNYISDYGVWAQGTFNKVDLSGAFNGDSNGIIAGIDAKIKNRYTLGIGYANESSDIKTDAHEIDVKSNSVFLYAKYKPNKWYINTLLNYMLSDYSEKTNAFGIDVESEYKTNAFGGQLFAGYDFDMGLTPNAGIRYLYLMQDEYNNGLADIKAENSNFLTAVAGVKYSVSMNINSNLSLKPDVYVNAVYDVLSDSPTADVIMPGGNSYVVKGDSLDKMGGEVGVALSLNYKEFDISLNYELQIRKDYSVQTGMLKFRYNF